MTSYGSLWCGLGLFTQIGHCARAHTPPTILENVGHYIKYKDKDYILVIPKDTNAKKDFIVPFYIY